MATTQSNFHPHAAFKILNLTLRRPEQVARSWHEQPGFGLIIWLLVNAAFGTAVYGLAMHAMGGAGAMLHAGLALPAAAGISWTLALPTLYIFRRFAGSNLSAKGSLLVASITVCFGAWAMLAGVPVVLFFTSALEHAYVAPAINLLVFAGVGTCMADVFLRVLDALEPDRKVGGLWWLALVGLLGGELFYITGIFNF